MNLLVAKEIQTDLTSEPLSTAAAKASMKITFNDDDALISSLCKAARLWLENYTGLQLGVKTLKVTVDLTAGELYELPGPVIGIFSLQINNDCVDYRIYGDAVEVYISGRCEIIYQAGFTTVPADILNDLKKIVAYLYQNRGIDLSNENATTLGFPDLASDFYRRVVI